MTNWPRMPDFVPVANKRLFHRNAHYSDINRKDLSDVIDAFRARIVNWYIRPAQKLRASSGHYSFNVVALTCMLVDTLAQYRYDLPQSNGPRFQDHAAIYQTLINPPIKYQFGGASRQITDYAMAVWVCYRCGILHESNVMLCGVISGERRIMQQKPGQWSTMSYAGASPGPSALRAHFASKFERSFGIPVPKIL